MRSWRMDPKIKKLKWKINPVQTATYREENWAAYVQTGA